MKEYQAAPRHQCGRAYTRLLHMYVWMDGGMDGCAHAWKLQFCWADETAPIPSNPKGLGSGSLEPTRNP